MTISVPVDDDFDEGQDFLEAPQLAGLASKLIADEMNRFGAIAPFEVSYLWKKHGGKTRGALKMGMTKKTTGDLKYFSNQDAVIWLAADHHAGRTDRQIEATLYHELLHLWTDPEDETGALRLVGHDFEGFAAEVVKYGDVLEDVQAIAIAFGQLAMFEGER